MRPLRVAIVGAGPAGAYAAAQLLVSRQRPEVDIFERLPTPWGLLRNGVAPDHQEIKTLSALFDEQVVRDGCRFFGNVEVGEDISHEDLMRHYDAVVYAVGARTDKSLGIPGEDLPGSLPATELVGWYNGHPDYRDLSPDLSSTRAVVIGNGNVAADVTRLLVKSPDELAATDIADHALEALRSSRIEEVVVLGRRGPGQAAFTNAELQDLGRIAGVDVVVGAEDARLDPVSEEWLAGEASFTARKNAQLVQEFARQSPSGAPRRVVLRFLRSPVEIKGDQRVEAIEVCRNELLRSDDGRLQARPTREVETIECGLVLRSVGYRAVPLPGVPFDEHRQVLRNERGRVEPGVYAVGWIKRGPTGILGTNKRDAEETVRCLLEDIDAEALPEPAIESREEVDAWLAQAVPEHVTFDGWRAIDEREVANGAPEGRPRVKFSTVDDLLAASRTLSEI